MRQNPHVRICGGPGSATTLVYPTPSGRQVRRRFPAGRRITPMSNSAANVTYRTVIHW